MNVFPGFSPSSPKAPEPLPPPVTREDPAIGVAREKLRLSEKKRKGRRASILTGSRGAEENLGSIKQASAGGASVLG